MGRKDELSKLARVRVDIPNDLDYMWNIDVKKSSAKLPDIIKRNLYNAVYDSISNSENVHKYRGRRTSNNVNYLWERKDIRGNIEYSISREIPQLKLLKKSLNEQQNVILESLLKKLEESLPINALYIDACNGNVNQNVCENEEELYNDVMMQLEYAKEQKLDYKLFLNAFLKTEPYCNNKNLIEKIKGEFQDE